MARTYKTTRTGHITGNTITTLRQRIRHLHCGGQRQPRWTATAHHAGGKMPLAPSASIQPVQTAITGCSIKQFLTQSTSTVQAMGSVTNTAQRNRDPLDIGWHGHCDEKQRLNTQFPIPKFTAVNGYASTFRQAPSATGLPAPPVIGKYWHCPLQWGNTTQSPTPRSLRPKPSSYAIPHLSRPPTTIQSPNTVATSHRQTASTSTQAPTTQFPTRKSPGEGQRQMVALVIGAGSKDNTFANRHHRRRGRNICNNPPGRATTGNRSSTTTLVQCRPNLALI